MSPTKENQPFTITLVNFLYFLIWSLVLSMPLNGHAELLSAAEGITFDAPKDLIAQPKQPSPIVYTWKDTNDSIGVTVIAVASDKANTSANAKEFQNWPDVSRSFIQGFGKSNASTLEKALNAKCSFVGMPRSQDLDKMAIQVEIETTCNTGTDPFFLRSRIIQVLTQSNTVIFRIDSQKSADAKAQAINANIWQSIKIANDQKVLPPVTASESNNVSEMTSKPVVGGTGIKIKDYSLLNKSYIIGNYFGAIIGSILFGMLFSIFFMKIKIPPIPSLLCAQILIIFLRILGDKENGTWELDPVQYLVTTTIAILALKKWATNRWNKTQQPAAT